MKKYAQGKALDFVQTVYMAEHVPIVYCDMVMAMEIDVARLKKAVKRTTEIVPQILCRYDDQRNRWDEPQADLDSIVKIRAGREYCPDLIWDLSAGPQLKIVIYGQRESEGMQIGMSHILTDGAGLLQYLALLCGFYNEPDLVDAKYANHRSILPLLYHTAKQRRCCRHRSLHSGSTPSVLPKAESEPDTPNAKSYVIHGSNGRDRSESAGAPSYVKRYFFGIICPGFAKTAPTG